MQLLDGKLVSDKIKKRLKTIDKTNKKLVVIRVGNDEASKIYLKAKENAAKEINLDFEKIELAKSTNQELINIIKNLNQDPKISGIIIQLPLPKNIDSNIVIEAIDSKKDVDGLTLYNQNNLLNNPYHIPCTPKGVIRLLEEYDIELRNKNIVIIGRSKLVGSPLAKLLETKKANVIVCHSQTENISKYTKKADILISAVGKKHLISKDMVKPNSIIIDIGITREGNKLYGDIDFENVKEICSYITPVPGGVGPMTIAMLLENTITP